MLRGVLLSSCIRKRRLPRLRITHQHNDSHRYAIILPYTFHQSVAFSCDLDQQTFSNSAILIQQLVGMQDKRKGEAGDCERWSFFHRLHSCISLLTFYHSPWQKLSTVVDFVVMTDKYILHYTIMNMTITIQEPSHNLRLVMFPSFARGFLHSK